MPQSTMASAPLRHSSAVAVVPKQVSLPRMESDARPESTIVVRVELLA
jgi:hypothetical protein